ncbi:MAG: isocitrate lyase/phosphoenolpyruvate mutase family protein [Pseudomonadota bacterium]
MSQWSERRQKFRAILSGDRCVHPGSVHDAISGRIAQHVGYELGMLGGSSAALAAIGSPDLIVLTLTEFADQCLRINRACELPMMVDADHGYGNALNVMRTVEELNTAGVSGLSIEDTNLPATFGSAGKAEILSLEEGLGKMRAAVAARKDPDLVIAARTSAVAISGVDDAVARVKAYQETGVDAIFLVGVKTRAEFDAVSEAVKLPIIMGGTTPELDDLDYLTARGARVCLQGHLPIQAAIQAIYNTHKSMLEGTKPKDVQGLPSKELTSIAMRGDDYDRWAKDFLEP